MRYPKFLPEKGTIGFVAPSFGCATEPYYTAFLNAQKKFQKMGYGLDLGPNCYVAEGIGISNTPQACGKEQVCGAEMVYGLFGQYEFYVFTQHDL